MDSRVCIVVVMLGFTLFSSTYAGSREVAMFAIDASNIPPSTSPVVMAQVVSATRPSSNLKRTIGVCGLVESPARVNEDGNYSAVNGLSPLVAAMNYLYSVENKDVRFPGKVTVIQPPQHGELKQIPDDSGSFWYLSRDKYLGADQAIFLVEVGGIKVEVHYFIRVLDGVADDYYEDKAYCPKGDTWKISLSDVDAVSSFADQFNQDNKVQNG